MSINGSRRLHRPRAYSLLIISTSISENLCDPGTHPMYLSHPLISGQFYCVLTTTFYPLISIYSNIRIISLILAARKNSKIAITRSCHLVSAMSANLRLLHLYQFTPVRWTFLYAITDIKNCMCNYWYRIYTAMDFPCFISILSNHYNIQSYCCLITASYYINCAIDSESDISWINYSYIIEEVCTSYRRPRHT